MADLSRNEYIKEASDYLRGTLAEGLADEITGAIVEDDQQLVKFHGMYLQDDRDLRAERTRKKLEKAFAFMLRVRISGGVLTTKQWRALDWIARVYGNGTMRATTRQTIQLHGVIKSNLKATLKAIDEQLLNTIAACGDVNRNVMCNPNPYQSKAHAAALQLARDISNHLEPHTGAYREIWLDGEKIAGGEPEEVEPIYGKTYLPRKFKTVVAVPPSNDVDIFAHDLGFIAILDDGGRHRRLERDRRRRHGHDARRARHLSAHGRRDGLLRDARRDRGRRGGRHRAARLGRPLEPQARAAEIHHRGPRARCVPRRGGEARRREARRAEAVHLHVDGRPLRLDRRRQRQGAPHALCAERPHPGRRRRRRDADRPAQDRRGAQGRHAAHREPERDHRECFAGGARRPSRRS